MKRLIGIVDIGIAVVVLVALLLPPREMSAAPVLKTDDAQAFALALAEARTMASPADGVARADLTRRLSEARLSDWAIEDAIRGSDKAKDAPTRWRALLGASVAFVDRLDAVRGLDYANRALVACDSAHTLGTVDACPKWEEIRMQLYQEHLDAGVRSHIDPKRDPLGFRRAGEKGIRAVHITGHDAVVQPQGSGSAH